MIDSEFTSQIHDMVLTSQIANITTQLVLSFLGVSFLGGVFLTPGVGCMLLVGEAATMVGWEDVPSPSSIASLLPKK